MLLFVAFCLALMSSTPTMAQHSSRKKDYTPDRLTLNLPEGRKLHFRAVYLGVNKSDLFAARQFQLGLRGDQGPDAGPGNYKEQLMDVYLSGSFVGNRNGNADWLYYMGETELQRNQWNAVMRWLDKKQGLPQRPSDDARFPQTGVTIAEIYQFVEALNTWLLTEQKNSLPTFRGAVGFCRLPTEAEWEFAARGGIVVWEKDRDAFNRPHPYPAELAQYEWFRNNAEKVRECGDTYIKANDLGLYDMLGNVEELTISLFSPEYVQGRFGDFSVRGANFSSSEAELSASRRCEFLTYQMDGTPWRPEKIGFRLVLGTRVSSVQAGPAELDDNYYRYRQQRNPDIPGPARDASALKHAQQDQSASIQQTLDQQRADNERLSLQIAEQMKREQELYKKIAHSEKAENTNDVLVAKNNELLNRLAQKDQELADLRRRAAMVSHEVDKNVGRIRQVEKRYLEALMREASAKAYLGWRCLKNVEYAVAQGGIEKTSDLYEKKMGEASGLIHGYYSLVIQIAETTQVDLFSEVKTEVSDWQQAHGKQEDGKDKNYLHQSKTLDLLERHVRERRKGQYHQIDHIVKFFTREPELK